MAVGGGLRRWLVLSICSNGFYVYSGLGSGRGLAEKAGLNAHKNASLGRPGEALGMTVGIQGLISPDPQSTRGWTSARCHESPSARS